MKTYKIFCAGEFVTSSTGHEVTDKYTNAVFANTFLADEKMLQRAITSAHSAEESLGASSSLERFEWLSNISSALQKNKTHLATVLARESGKPLIYATAEIDRASQTFLIAAEECKRLPREYMSLDWTTNGKNKEGLVKYFPVGVVAGISPFNFPMNLAVHKIAPAIAAGCPIILKPASTTPLSTLELATIISETGIPKGSVSILPMDRKTGNLLVTDPGIDMLSFTGSPEVGWKMKEQAGKKKVLLELGGNAGVIISDKTNISKIIPKCVGGAFAYSGQICIHAQRFYVHPALYDQFCKLMEAGTITLEFGNPTDKNTRISKMIDEDNAKRVEAWVNEAVQAGARILCGGKREHAFYEPTILTGTTTSMKVNCEEVFGPVVCIEKYSGDFADAVRLINESKYGLQCGVFTDSVEELDLAFNKLKVGGIIHNDVPTLRFDQMPYGGIKESGLGREGVAYAIREMMEARVLVK
jgi:acyl-CoA reductase-like NAD-dependent aldehyde dehydrogenase